MDADHRADHLRLDRTQVAVPRFMVLLGLAQLDALGVRATTRKVVEAVTIVEDGCPPGELDAYAMRYTRRAIRDMTERGWVGRVGRELWLTPEGRSVLSIAFVGHLWLSHDPEEES